MAEVQVLFEYKDSRRQLTLLPTAVCEVIAEEMVKFGYIAPIVKLSTSERASVSSHADEYLLQRWSQRWNTFVDVQKVDEIHDHDRLTVIPKPVCSPQKLSTQQTAQNIVAHVSQPSKADAKALATYFPSIKSKEKERAPFDPLSGQWKRKKRDSFVKARLVKVTVVLLKEHIPSVPKGKFRQQLASSGRIMTLKLHRGMSSKDVREKIEHAFNTDTFVFLECDNTGHHLVRGADQDLNGEEAVERKGCLYLCERFPEETSKCTTDSDDSSVDVIKPKRKRKQALHTRKEMSDDSDFESTGPVLQKANWLIKELKKPIGDAVITVPSSDEDDANYEDKQRREEYIKESRQLREEQDRAFAESLQIDQAKNKAKAEQARRHELRQRLQDKWRGEMNLAGGSRFTLRFPDSSKVDVSLPCTSSSKVLYEIALAFGSLTEPFCIYTLRPRTRVPHDGVITDIGEPPLVLVVEDSSDGPDLECIASLHEPSMVAEEPSKASSDNSVLQAVEAQRLSYVMDTLDTHHGLPHLIRREQVFEDVIDLYTSKAQQILQEFPFRIRYNKEKAIDTGGVCRDMFSGFWSDAYLRAFDGGSVLVPAVHPHANMAIYPVLGTVLSHGFMVCGFLPIRLAFPVVAATVHGPTVAIPDAIIIQSFADYLSSYESTVIREALVSVSNTQLKTFSDDQLSQLISILSRLGCREIPRPDTLKRLIIEVARHELLTKPLGALYALRSGVPVPHHGLWDQIPVSQLFDLYKALNATQHQVLRIIKEPEEMSSVQARVFGYLLTMIGNMKGDELSNFLRFVTGSSVLIAKEISVSFNNLSGLLRRPISHTCSNTLELPTTYLTYPEFAQEFFAVLTSEAACSLGAWAMDAL